MINAILSLTQMKRFGLMMLMLALMVSLAGCGGSRGGSDGMVNVGSSEPPGGGGGGGKGGGGGGGADPF